jgi:hypothetical protein
METRRETKKLVKYGSLGLLAAVVLVYTIFQFHNILTGPEVSISSPPNGAHVATALTEITGNTQNISAISLNDRPIFIDESGEFKEKILLQDGYNVLKIQAEDKFGRKTERMIELTH